MTSNIDYSNQHHRQRRRRHVRSSSFHNHDTTKQQQQQQQSRKRRSHSIHELPSQLEFNLSIEQQRQRKRKEQLEVRQQKVGEYAAKEGNLLIAYRGQNHDQLHCQDDYDDKEFYEVKEEHEEGRAIADAANITTARKVGADHTNAVAKTAVAAVIPPIFKEHTGINEIRTYKLVHNTALATSQEQRHFLGQQQSWQQQSRERQQQQHPQQKPSASTTTAPPTMDQIQATMKNARRGLLSQKSRRKALEGMLGGTGDDDDAVSSSVRAGSSLLDGDLSSADNGGRNVINNNSSKTNMSNTTNIVTSSNNRKKQPNNNPNIDILTEGQYFLSISMLVYMYSQLRETCRMGHTRVTMEEIDCNNSCDQKMIQYTPPSLVRASSERSECSYLGDNTTTLTAGSIIRIVIDELEEEQDDIMHDPTTDEQHRQYEKFMMIQFKQWIEDSRVSQLDADTEDLIKMLRKKAAVARWKRAKNLILMGRILSRGRLSGMDSEDGGNNNNNGGGGEGIDETNANPNKKQMIHYLRRQVARYRWKCVINKVILAVRLCHPRRPVFDVNSIPAGGKGNRFVNLQAMLQEALAKQPSYFIEGSVMYNLVESSLEVVWFSDLSQSDVVYGICVQREEKKITVVFRGTVTAHNWAMNFRYNMMDVANPVKDYYPGRAETLSLHSGFALYLLRKRKDTRMSKMDEIFEKVQQIGNELAPDGDYELCITGHSLGGALATLFAFYCGARHEHVRLYTFASPRVGGEAFLYAYQHLERAGRIRHARFSCTNDIVPLIPFCNFEPDNLKFYKHVGMRVQLHDTGRIGKWRLRKRLDVTYPLHHDWPSQFARGLMNCILANPNTPLGYRSYHHLTEYQRRLHFAMTYRKALGSTVFFLDEKRQRLKSLEEYYAIRGSMESDVVAFTQTFLPATDWRRIIRKCTTLFLVAPLMYAWVNLLSVVTSAEIIIPKVAYWIFIEQLPRVVKAIPYYAILQYLLQLTLVLTFIMEMIKMVDQSKPFKIRWVKFQKIFGRLVIVTPLLTLWLKLISCLTNMDVMNIAWSILQHTTHLWKLLPVLTTIMVPSLKISFALSFVMIVLGTIIPMREKSSQWKRHEKRLGKLLFIAPLLLWLFFLFVSPQASDVRRVSGSAGWGLRIENAQSEQRPNTVSSSKMDIHEKNLNDDDSTPDSKLHPLRADLKPIQEYATGIKFEPTLDNGLYLVGAGVRKKSVIKVYAVAMYSTPQVLTSSISHASLHDAARTFDSSSSMTSFVLEMVYSAGAEKIAGAIGESVKPRHNGDPSDISVLESLIVNGVKAIGGQAIKGTIFRFDCSDEGVSVSVNGAEQGKASFEGLGSAFVDVFMDSNSVSPTLKDSCVNTWSTNEMKSVSASLIELASVVGSSSQDASGGEESQDKPEKAPVRNEVESQLKPIQEYATSVVFDPKLDDGLYLVGAGVRKKSVIKVYAVAMYSSASVLSSTSSPATLNSVARNFNASTPVTSFVLEMVYSAGAEKIGGAIAESVKPRYNGPAADISVLESLIVEGVNKKGGQATKGTIFRFDCSAEVVVVSVDGSMQGTAKFDGMGSAFVDVFLDDNAVSPNLVSSCMDTWSNPQAKVLAASLLELDEAENNVQTDEDDVGDSGGDEGLAAHPLTEVEAQLKPIQEYATSITFEPKLEDNGLYLVGASVRKKSVIKVYAVAMYSTPQVLTSATSYASLHDAARTFESSSSMTSFVLQMVYSAGAEKIAGAIAESVKPRYNGDPSDIGVLESLIVNGVKAIGGQAIKGTIFRFDCSKEGVSVSVNGAEQGMASFEDLGSAFVDVFMDSNSVSPTLKDSCVSTWSNNEAKSIAASLVELDLNRMKMLHASDGGDGNKHNDGAEETSIHATDEIEQNETMKISSSSSSNDLIKSHEEHEPKLKVTVTPPPPQPPKQQKQRNHLVKRLVKYAFPVF